MKKVLDKLTYMILVAAMVFTNNSFCSVYASNSNTVKYTNNSGVIRIYGKGNMPKSMTFKNNKKIKKVIIKNRVTKISKRAFYKCKNIKSIKIGNKVKVIGRYAFYKTNINKLYIPKSVKTIGVAAFKTRSTIKTVSMPGKVKTKTAIDYESPIVMNNVKKIKFTTNLDINTLNILDAENFVVNDSDKNYSSKNGIILSKDGTEVLRLPNREEVNVPDGCKEFDINSYMYALYMGDDMYEAKCDKVKKIVLPESIDTITNSSKDSEYSNIVGCSFDEIEIKNINIDEDSLNTLIEACGEKYKLEKTDSSILLKVE